MRKKDWNSITGKRYDAMMARCYRPKNAAHKRYAELDIRVTSDWVKDINSFRTWCEDQLVVLGITKQDVIDNPKKFSLDRIDPRGHYTPENCRFVDQQTQSRNKVNRRVLKVISAEGEEIFI